MHSGIACTSWASEAHLGLHVDTLQARVRDPKGTAFAREGMFRRRFPGRLLDRRTYGRERRRPMSLPLGEKWVSSRLIYTCFMGILVF